MTSELTARMVESRQLSALDADALARMNGTAPESEEDILRWLAGEYGLEFTALENAEPDRDILARFPARILLREEMLPLRQTDGHVEVALSRLFAAPGLDSLKSFTDLKLRPVLAPSAALQREIKKHLGVGADTLNLLEQEEGFQVVADDRQDDGDLDKAAEDASIIRFVNQILGDALSMRTSDIHVEPFEHELRIRYRIDGLLQEVSVPGQIKRFQPAIVSRIKILSNLNIAEKRVPQDGRIKIRVKGADVDIRVSVIPMLHGEAVVMRLLRQSGGTVPGLAGLNMAERERRLFERVLDMPHGIALVTGPTGSGKSTTLYSALSQINDSVRKIITVEDPVEYQIKGINQIQVSEKAGLTFARGLRAILRHDPDVVLVGEIRDQETAQIAVQASLTGHMVFSTLHTNDAPGALTRLVDMGVEPYLVASSLEAVMAQRLVRKLCPECKRPDTTVRTRELRENIPALREVEIFAAVGCKHCRTTGYSGRQAVFELMSMSPDIRKVLLRGGSSLEVKEVARKEGMHTLIEDGWRLVREGITTPSEVMRVSKDEDAAMIESQR